MWDLILHTSDLNHARRAGRLLFVASSRTARKTAASRPASERRISQESGAPPFPKVSDRYPRGSRAWCEEGDASPRAACRALGTRADGTCQRGTAVMLGLTGFRELALGMERWSRIFTLQIPMARPHTSLIAASIDQSPRQPHQMAGTRARIIQTFTQVQLTAAYSSQRASPNQYHSATWRSNDDFCLGIRLSRWSGMLHVSPVTEAGSHAKNATCSTAARYQQRQRARQRACEMLC